MDRTRPHTRPHTPGAGGPRYFPAQAAWPATAYFSAVSSFMAYSYCFRAFWQSPLAA